MPRGFRPFTVNPKAFHELVIEPMFGDYLPTNGPTQPSLEDGDWALMDNVKWRVPIIAIKGNQNVLKRRDHTCKFIYTPVGRTSQRYVYAEELYAAAEDCTKEFYQGCMIDYTRENFNIFFQRIMPILETAVATDIYTNKYFGDIERPADPTGTYSWDKFDGVFTHLARYMATGVLPEAQTFAIEPADPDSITSTEAHDYLQAAWAAQPFMLKVQPNAEKAIYVSDAVYQAYWDWLVLAGVSLIAERQAGASTLTFRGIEVRPKPLWDPILTMLNGGTPAHIILLTLKGNFLYLTDSSYGGGAFDNEAVRVWYSDDDGVWRRQIHLKAGTEWINPELVVYGSTEF